MYKAIITIGSVLLFITANVASAGESHKYIGVQKCSMCHKSEKKGDQYGKWLSTKHAKAYETLGTEAAKETAAKAGVSGNPQEAPECLKCHVTAYGVDASLRDEALKMEDGVQCESCHGAGGDYKSMSLMKDQAKAIEAGLIIPSKETCVKCHNQESPNFTGFDFEEFVNKIAHPYPDK